MSNNKPEPVSAAEAIGGGLLALFILTLILAVMLGLFTLVLVIIKWVFEL